MPKNLKDVLRFLGYANVYRQFIKNFSVVARPITDLTRSKDLDFHWGPLQTVAFQQLKDVFTLTPILKRFDPTLEVIIETDASNFAIGCILFQKQNGRLHLVAFYSRNMEPADRNHDIHDKELLAVVEAFKHWRPNCHGARFPILVITDHQNLRYFTTSKVLNKHQVHWAEKLSEFDFWIIYRAGSKNGKPDVLNRRSE
jgi:hypothetical protein